MARGLAPRGFLPRERPRRMFRARPLGCHAEPAWRAHWHGRGVPLPAGGARGRGLADREPGPAWGPLLHAPVREAEGGSTPGRRHRIPDKGPDPRRIFSLSLIHISEPTRLLSISYAVF